MWVHADGMASRRSYRLDGGNIDAANSPVYLIPKMLSLLGLVSNNVQIRSIVAKLISRDLTCARKMFPTPVHHRHQPVPLTPGRMGKHTHAAYAKT
jgi:hypothetical protein